MLRVAKLRVGGHPYYFEPLGLDGRPPTEAPGLWVGRGSAAFGLDGTVDRAALEAALAGTDPGGRVLPGADRRRVVVAGFDLSFGAPKSVSLLQALSERDVAQRVQAGHDRSVDAALTYLEERALAVRRSADELGRVPQPAEAAPMAAFVHRTSRALDPNLHTHVVLANVARGLDGSWSALDGRGVYAHAAAAGALYHAQLRYELTEALGVAWGPLAHGRADVAGISPEVRRAFSRRSEEIAAHLAERGLIAEGGGPVSRRAAHVAGLATRATKDLDIGADDLRPHWREQALHHGLGPRRLEALLDRAPRRGLDVFDPAAVDSRDVADALAAGRGPDRAFARRDVVRAWSAALPHGGPSTQVSAVVDRFLDDVCAEIDDRPIAAGGRRRDAPGVAEPRMELPERLRQRELELLLERRGMAPAREVDRDRGIEIGMG